MNTLLAVLVRNRMPATRVLIFIIAVFILFAKPIIAEDSPIHEFMDWAGYGLIIICVLGRCFCALFIGGRKNDTLVVDGIYSVVRNPLYVFSFIGTVGIGLQTGIFTLCLALITLFIVYYPHVVSKEENFLLARFGTPYQEYLDTVHAWVPNFSKLSYLVQGNVSNVNLRVFLKTTFDAALFFLAFPVLELLEYLHVTGAIPTYFALY